MPTSPGISRNFDEAGRVPIEKATDMQTLVIVHSMYDTHVPDSQR